MKKALIIIALLSLPFSAQAAGYGAYGVYGYQGQYSPHGYQGRFSPYGYNGPNIYIAPQQPVVTPLQQPPSYANELNQMSQSALMMEQARMLQMQRQQMYQQQQAQQRQQVMAWQKFLTEQGHDPGPVDGVWGPRSAQAYQEYLAKQNGQQAK